MPAAVKRRLRLRFLQRAAAMRAEAAGQRRRVIPAWPRVAITSSLVLVLVLTSTGLVRASSTAVPGDQLYTVKRSWEDVRLWLSPQPSVQYRLASEFEQERLDEIRELLALGRAVPITFSGLVGLKSDGDWTVSDVPVSVPQSAVLSSGVILEGQPVVISGLTRADGTVVAERIELLLPGAALPPLAPSADDDALDVRSESESEQDQWARPLTESAPAYVTYEFTGIVERLGTDLWQINQQQVIVRDAQIIGSIKVGSEVKFEGYYTPKGTFVATHIETAANLRYDDGRDDGQGGNDNGSSAEKDTEDYGNDDGHDTDH